MPPKQSAALLFHPKKKNGKDAKIPPPRPRPKPPGAEAAEKTAQDDDDSFQLPDTPFQEYRLLSSSLRGWKYDVMKFDSRKPVDLLKWAEPVKLNRKDLRRDDRTAAANSVPRAVGPMLGADGKKVVGADGKTVMVDAEGRPIHDSDETAAANGKDKGKGPNGRKRFQKKTKQVYIVPDEIRALTKEERYPWVMEDSSVPRKEHWIGQLEDASKAKTHAFFMPTANDAFKFVPAHRWYKFQKKLHHSLPTNTADVETAYTRSQKRDPAQYLASLHGGRGASASTAALFKAEADVKPMIVDTVVGGRKLKTVDQPMPSLFDDDEDGDSKKRSRGMGEEGDYDEQVYEEEFADDEETMAVDHDDEEAKQTEERLKREYKQANKQRETGIDESEDEADAAIKKIKGGKKLKERLRKEGNAAYDSEEEENPYLSSAEEEEEEEEEEVLPTGPAIQQQPQQTDGGVARTNVQKPPPPRLLPSSLSGSRATSPVSPSLGGHSLIAKRATSPKVPKPNGLKARSNSGATSPNSPGSRATSPLAGAASNNKRKADEATNGSTASGNGPKPKRKKANSSVSVAPVSLAELEGLVLQWLKTTPEPKTRDCIAHFNPYLQEGDRKADFASIIKKLAFLKQGSLHLRPAFASAA